MVVKRKTVNSGVATRSCADRGMVAHLRKAGKTCAPEKIVTKAALQAAHKAVVQPRVGAKAPMAGEPRHRGELVDLHDFKDVTELVSAWLRSRPPRSVKSKSVVEPSTKKEPSAQDKEEVSKTKREAKPKSEMVVKRELVNEMMKLKLKVLEGIIDLTEAQPPRQGPPLSCRPSAKHAPVAKTARPSAATPVSRAKVGSVSNPITQTPNAARGKRRVNAKPVAAQSTPVKKTQVVRRLEKVVNTCAPQKLWSILKAAAQASGPSASVGAALRAASSVGTRRQRQVSDASAEE